MNSFNIKVHFMIRTFSGGAVACGESREQVQESLERWRYELFVNT